MEVFSIPLYIFLINLIKHMLEEYVHQQVRDGTYDLDANMALLKLYQFYPDRVRNEVYFFILVFFFKLFFFN